MGNEVSAGFTGRARAPERGRLQTAVAMPAGGGWGPLADHFALDRGVVFLNHGSFGATPRHVLAMQEAMRAQVEREPIRFFVEDLEPMLDEARERCAAFVGADAEGFAFVVNATAGVNTALRSVDLRAGDELLTTDHEYNACNNALEAVAERAQGGPARVVRAVMPFPLPRGMAAAERAVVDAFVGGLSERTRVVLVSHITSPSALVLPVRAIMEEVERRTRGRAVVVLDGAHAPGYLPLEVSRLRPAFYTGNFHKWACAPKGSAFLWAREDVRGATRPLIISHGANATRTDRSRYRLEMDYTGSMDCSAWLVTPACCDYVAGLTASATEAGSWDRVRERVNGLALWAREHLCERLGTTPPAPDGMLGAMAAVELPEPRGAAAVALAGLPPTLYHDGLQDVLLSRWGIQVPILRIACGEGRVVKRFVRVSAMLYNTRAQVEYVAAALRAELGLG